MKRKGDIFPLNDAAKRLLFIPRLMLEPLGFWPEKRTTFTKITNCFFIILLTVVLSGQVMFVFRNIKDLPKIAGAISTMSITFQSITKLSALYFINDEIKSVLSLIWYEFWPVTILGPKTGKELKFYNSMFIYMCIVMFGNAFLFSFGYLSSPLWIGKKILPFESIYPFDATKSPIYEILYVSQWMLEILYILIGICAHDYLFVGICSNIVSQYMLLKKTLGYLGTKNVEKLNKILLEFNKDQDLKNNKKNSENEKLMKICIQHHVLLTHVCKKVEEMFTFSSFIQLFASVVALCMATIIINFTDIDKTLLTTIGAYLLGHVFQLLLYCTYGNEVIHHADNLPTAAFSGEWYNIENLTLKKDIVFVIARAQKTVKLSALGIMTLDLDTFVGVLKFSFSVYTMLSTMTDRN